MHVFANPVTFIIVVVVVTFIIVTCRYTLQTMQVAA